MAAQVRDDSADQRYVIVVDDDVAGFSMYRPVDAETLDLFHTEVEDAYEGQGLGSQLVRGTLDDLRDRHVTVLPTCPFVRSYISEHREYVSLVPVAARGRFGLAE